MDPPVNPDPGSWILDSGWDCCKLEAKLARNGLFNKAAAALVLDPVEGAVVVEGYDTDGGNAFVELDTVEVGSPEALGGGGT